MTKKLSLTPIDVLTFAYSVSADELHLSGFQPGYPVNLEFLIPINAHGHALTQKEGEIIGIRVKIPISRPSLIVTQTLAFNLHRFSPDIIKGG